MARYIDADALYKKLYPLDLVDKRFYTINAKAVADAISKAPTFDVVEVVRCKECIYFEPYECTPFGNCKCKKNINTLAEITPNKEHFCSYGERRMT